LAALEQPIGLLFNGWKHLLLPRPKSPEQKPGFGAVMVADDSHTFPEMHLLCLTHPGVRKEGV